MEVKITIAQPYAVLWSRPNREEDVNIIDWVRDNVVEKHEIIVLGTNAKRIIVGSNEPEAVYFDNVDCLFLFESPRDALLFKLTWGGR